MNPANLPPQTLYRGDIWETVYHFGPITDSLTHLPPGEPALSCRMQFKNNKGELGYELNSVPTTGKGTITIVDAVNYEFDIPSQALPLEAGEWTWDFKTFETDDCTGLSRTFYKSKVFISEE